MKLRLLLLTLSTASIGVAKARSRAGGGAGLGPAIVKTLVKAHGGSVEVKSEPGKSSTFAVTLSPMLSETLSRSPASHPQ